jgi:hypothetical protein
MHQVSRIQTFSYLPVAIKIEEIEKIEEIKEKPESEEHVLSRRAKRNWKDRSNINYDYEGRKRYRRKFYKEGELEVRRNKNSRYSKRDFNE